MDTGPIFVKGGGNFGDLYPAHQRLREQVARDFPDNSIVQLPQTVYFEDEARLASARAVLGAHRDFTLMARDETSLALGRDRMGLRTLLAPDLACALPAPRRRKAPETDVLWLLRTDAEASAVAFQPDAERAPQDWPTDPKGGIARTQRHLTRSVARNPCEGFRTRRLRRTYEPLARLRLAAGYAQLRSARFVVTDRLHGHLLCVLLGIPNVLLDNRYGKNRTVFDRWTRDVPSVRWAERDVRAVARALQELRAHAGS